AAWLGPLASGLDLALVLQPPLVPEDAVGLELLGLLLERPGPGLELAVPALPVALLDLDLDDRAPDLRRGAGGRPGLADDHVQIDRSDGHDVAVPEDCMPGRAERAAVVQDGQGRGELAQADAVRPAADETDVLGKVRPRDAQVAPGDGADQELVAGDVERDRRGGSVPDFDADRRGGRWVSLVGALGHVRAVTRGVRTAA